MTNRTAHSVLAIDLHGKPDFHSRCPDHGKELKDGTWQGVKSTRFKGQQVSLEGNRYDVWYCKVNIPGYAGFGHVFTSVPAKGIPTDHDGLQRWLVDKQFEAATGTSAKKARSVGA